MGQYTCIERFKNKNGVIIGYRIKDNSTMEVRDIRANELKSAIYNHKITIDNLSLTNDGRLLLNNKKLQNNARSNISSGQNTLDMDKSAPRFRCMSIIIDGDHVFPKHSFNDYYLIRLKDGSSIEINDCKDIVDYFRNRTLLGKSSGYNIHNISITYELVSIPNRDCITLSYAELIDKIKNHELFVDNLEITPDNDLIYNSNIERGIEYNKLAIKPVLRALVKNGYSKDDIIVTCINKGIDDSEVGLFDVLGSVNNEKNGQTNILFKNFDMFDVLTKDRIIHIHCVDGNGYTVKIPGVSEMCPCGFWYDIDSGIESINANLSKSAGGYSEVEELITNYILSITNIKNRLNTIKKDKYTRGTLGYTISIDIMTIDELSDTLHNYIQSICSNVGGEVFDRRYRSNRYGYSSINKIRNLCIKRGYLTEEEFEDWMTGDDAPEGECPTFNDYHYNKYKFVDWILMHRK